MDVKIIGNFAVTPLDATTTFSKTGFWYDYFSGDSINVSSTSMTLPMKASEYKILTSVRLKKPEIITTVETTKTQGFENLTLYPNPCLNNLTIESSNTLNGGTNIYITNLQGQRILSKTTSGFEHKTIIDISYLESGLYIITVSNKDYSSKSTLLKIK